MPADPDLKRAISAVAYWIHAHLEGSGKWRKAQEEVAAEVAAEYAEDCEGDEHDEVQIPEILSTHLCRETSMFTRAMLEASGFTGWILVSGEVDLNDVKNVPEDIEEFWAAHTWLVHEEAGLLLDMTADQFGPDFCPKPGPKVVDMRDAIGYLPGVCSANWYEEGSTLPETVGAWLNLADGELATPDSRPLPRRPEPLSDMLRMANGEAIPEKDPEGERLMFLIAQFEEIRAEMEPAAPGIR